MERIGSKPLGFVSTENFEFPRIINIEVFRGTCPCSCVHCPVGATEHKHRKERFGSRSIDLELYKKIIDEISEYSHAVVRIHSVGEPLMWVALGDVLKLHNQSIKSWLFTSAVTSDMSLLETICDNTYIIEVSVNSTTPKDYEKTKGVNAFQKVCENISYMHDFIEKNGLPTRLIASRVQSTDKMKDKEFVQYWKSSGLVNDAFVRSYHTYNDLMGELETEEIPKKHEPCLVHWARFNISVEGYAVVCFNELFREPPNTSLIIGDVKKQTIAEIWQCGRLTSLREAELTGNYSNNSFVDTLPCKDCYSFQPVFGTRQTSEHQIRNIK
ncbi:MAG: radical SAM protein [Deltaproteobacteria bacterium]|nr:radical SAM protein [Deltaproteobacteria bacterium]